MSMAAQLGTAMQAASHSLTLVAAVLISPPEAAVFWCVVHWTHPVVVLFCKIDVGDEVASAAVDDGVMWLVVSFDTIFAEDVAWGAATRVTVELTCGNCDVVDCMNVWEFASVVWAVVAARQARLRTYSVEPAALLLMFPGNSSEALLWRTHMPNNVMSMATQLGTAMQAASHSLTLVAAVFTSPPEAAVFWCVVHW
jgi:hypothetical protein